MNFLTSGKSGLIVNSVFHKGGHQKNANSGMVHPSKEVGLYILYNIYIYIIMDVEPKIVGKPPKMDGEKFMEKPMNKWTIWGYPKRSESSVFT